MLPRAAFKQAVAAHGGDRYTKGFGCWDQLVAMVYAQLSGAASLRQLEAGFNQHFTHHYHLGCRPVRRSTLADANARRNPQIFAHTASALMQQAGRRIRGEREQMQYLLDSSSIALRGRGSQWTQATRTRTPGLKLHVLYASAAQAPLHHSITPANVNDLDEGRKLPIEAGATYVFDKGYCDYNWWARIDEAGARFVTRLKRGAALHVLSARAVPPDAPHVLSDAIVAFARHTPRGGHRNSYSTPLRRIEIARTGDTPLVLVTNDLHSDAVLIAQLYKDRWGIELFFKWIKQHLSIKRFLGESDNAVRIQLLTALIAYLLVLLAHRASAPSTTLWHFLAQLRSGLFQRPDQQLSWWRRRQQRLAAINALQPQLFP
jgi:IS4 transposase